MSKTNFVSGAVDKSLDLRDVNYANLGSISRLPETLNVDPKKFTRHSQDDSPTCGAHAGVHTKQILDKKDTGKQSYSPLFLWKIIKSFDGYPPSVGTDLRSIMKALKHWGVCDYTLLPSDWKQPIEEYSKNDLTKKQLENAKPRLIGSYAFMGGDRELIKRAIYDNGACLLYLRFGNKWWRGVTMTDNEAAGYGHFAVAYDWDGDDIKIIDSADDKYPFKVLKPSFVIHDSGVVTDVPDAVIRELVQRAELLQKIVQLLRWLKIIK